MTANVTHKKKEKKKKKRQKTKKNINRIIFCVRVERDWSSRGSVQSRWRTEMVSYQI